jgi:hypothetical protein
MLYINITIVLQKNRNLEFARLSDPISKIYVTKMRETGRQPFQTGVFEDFQRSYPIQNHFEASPVIVSRNFNIRRYCLRIGERRYAYAFSVEFTVYPYYILFDMHMQSKITNIIEISTMLESSPFVGDIGAWVCDIRVLSQILKLMMLT